MDSEAEQIRLSKQNARALLEGKKINEARRAFKDISRQQPTDAEAWHFLGVCNGLLGMRLEAEDCFRQSIINHSPSAHTYHNLALLLMEH